MEKIIKGMNIRKTYRKDQEENFVLNGINIEIEQQEFVVVMGPSGCGKSTLLFALSGTDDITDGTIMFDNTALSNLKENELADIRRQKMGFIFQQPTMLKNLNIMDNILLPALQGNSRNCAELSNRAKSLMMKTGIDGLGSRDINEVSGGQLQRAGICRALMSSPHILFADEPTGALNSRSADEIMTLITEINQEGTAILLVTHDAKVASRADRVLFMKDGNIVKELNFEKYDGTDMDTRTATVVESMREIDI